MQDIAFSASPPPQSSARIAAAPQAWRRSWVRIAPLTILVVVLAKVVSILISGFGTANPWYDRLDQPFALPMQWVYPIAWPIMCVLLGIIWAKILSIPPSTARLGSLIFFYVGLVLNFAWLPIFLAAHDITLAKHCLGICSIMIVASFLLFFSIRRVAGLLLLPYLAWVIFVTAWMVGIERLNPAAGGSILQLTEGTVNAIREENGRRLRESDEWFSRDDRRDGSGSGRNDPRKDPRMDRRERGDN